MSVFEIIDEDEFRESERGVFDNTVETGRPTIPRSELVWCEFCKGNYIEEFHFGDRREEDE